MRISIRKKKENTRVINQGATTKKRGNEMLNSTI